MALLGLVATEPAEGGQPDAEAADLPRGGRRCAVIRAVSAHAPCSNGARIAALSLLLGVGVALGAEPKEWLERMNKALTTRNYVGVFTHVHGGRVETLRIIHRVRGRDVSERLLSLDGSGREFIREGDELTCYFPDKRTVLVERRSPDGPLLGALPADRRWRFAGLRDPRRRTRATARPHHARGRAASAR